jgi:hypothetical protein
VSVLEAKSTDKSQAFVTGITIIDNIPEEKVESIRPKQGYVFLMVTFALSGFTAADQSVRVSNEDIQFIAKDGGKEGPCFESSYEDSSGGNQFAWSWVTDSITFTKGTQGTCQVVFVVKRDQLTDCKVRIFDKVFPVTVKAE